MLLADSRVRIDELADPVVQSRTYTLLIKMLMFHTPGCGLERSANDLLTFARLEQMEDGLETITFPYLG